MEKITLPSKVAYRVTEQDDRHATLTVEPLYPGYGVTVGNALRRVLLSSLPGAAVTAFKVAGVSHEFSTIDHVKEDVIEITMNLKQVRFISHAKEPVTLKLIAKGEGPVTAKNIEANPDVEIVNPDHQILTLTDKDATLEMELVVDRGRGYITVEQREGEKLDIGWIAVDSIYSPIEKINFKVEAARVGQITNFDKLVMDITTDGTITPQAAIERSSQILVDHFQLLAQELVLEEGEEDTKRQAVMTEEEEEAPSAEEGGSSSTASTDSTTEEETPASSSTNEPGGDEEQRLNTAIEELGLSTRTVNALYNNDIKTAEDIVKLSQEELVDLQGLGGKAVSEVEKALKKLDLTLADAVEEGTTAA